MGEAVGVAEPVGVGEAVGVGAPVGDGRDDERPGEALAEGEGDRSWVGVTAARWCAGAGWGASLPGVLPWGAALALVLAGAAAEQLTTPQLLATRRPSSRFIRMNMPAVSAAAVTPARSAPYQR